MKDIMYLASNLTHAGVKADSTVLQNFNFSPLYFNVWIKAHPSLLIYPQNK